MAAREDSEAIPVYEPYFGTEEEDLVRDCIRSTWVASAGKYLNEFEEGFAKRCGSRHAIAVTNGTAAIHLALHALGIGPGDEVLVPSLTFVATASAVTFTGATPVFVDSDPETWNISVDDARRHLTSRTRAIIPVHLFGLPARMPDILAFSENHGLCVIEDAAEAHFARIGTRCVGTFGRAAAFSFYGNKVMTTGEGGMITTQDDDLAGRIRYLRDHAMSPSQRYWHDEIGFNYRMTNLQAALGVAQLGKVDTILERKARIAEWYAEFLGDVSGLSLPPVLPDYASSHWMFSILVRDGAVRNRLMADLTCAGIDTRPFFVPLHTLPPFRPRPACPVAVDLAERGLSLPSSAHLDRAQVERVASAVRAALR